MFRSVFLTLAAIATCTSVLGVEAVNMGGWPVEDDSAIPVPSPTEPDYVPVDFEGAMRLLEALSSKKTITATTPPICVKKFLLQKTSFSTKFSSPSYAFQVEGCKLKEPNGKGYCPSSNLVTAECQSAVFEVILEPKIPTTIYYVTSISWLD